MTDTEKKGILSFFQNVPSKKSKTNDRKKKKKDNDIKSTVELDNEKSIILVDGQDELQKSKDVVDSVSKDKEPSIIELNETIDETSNNTEPPSEQSEIETKEVVTNPHVIEEADTIQNKEAETSRNNDVGELTTSPPPSSQDIFDTSIIEESYKEDQPENTTNTTNNDNNETKPLTKKDQLKKDKEIRKLKREQEQLLKKQKREEEKLKREKLRVEEKLKKEKLREEEKVKKEKRREEEKRKKEQQKEEEKIKREEAKKAKEEEKRKREEEKLKIENEKKAKQEAKERSQLRIGNFFKKSSNDSSKPISTKSDYEKTFLPFYAKDNIIISNNLILSKNKINSSKQSIDDQLSNQDEDPLLDWIKSIQTKRGYPIKFKAVTLLQQMTTKEKTDEELQILLSLIPQKYIKFYENIRPPFIGTYSKDLILPISQPFTTEGTGYNYDYDSDLEWVNEEEDADGADIDNLESGEEDEDEEDDEDGSEGEFDGFLDAEDSNNTKPSKKKIIGPLIPVVQLRSQLDQLEKDDQEYFRSTSAQLLVETLTLPIDPFQRITIRKQIEQSTDNSPTKESSAGAKRTINDVSTSVTDQPTDAKKAKTLITESKGLLKLFDEIHGSTFSLGTITEIAQKSLPQYNKLTIKHTIREYAARASPKVDPSRKWEIKDKTFWDQLKSSIE